MKKFIASVMVICISATFLFAGTPAVPAHDEYAFFDVEGVELTDAEKVEVEGGFGHVPVFVAVGAATGAGINIVSQVVSGNKKIDKKEVAAAAVTGGVAGLVTSLGSPAGIAGVMFTVSDGIALGATATVTGAASGWATKAVLDTVDSNKKAKK